MKRSELKTIIKECIQELSENYVVSAPKNKESEVIKMATGVGFAVSNEKAALKGHQIGLTGNGSITKLRKLLKDKYSDRGWNITSQGGTPVPRKR